MQTISSLGYLLPFQENLLVYIVKEFFFLIFYNLMGKVMQINNNVKSNYVKL